MSQFVPHGHIPYGEDGTGQYSKHLTGANDVMLITAGTKMALKSLDKVTFDENGRFMICDFGASDGGSSMPLLRDIIAALRSKYGKQFPIEIVYEDQPVNDFKSVFLRVHNLLPDAEPSFINDSQNVFVYCCGTNFYEQCFPPESLSFAFSFMAIHWLSTNPCLLQNGIAPCNDGISEEEMGYFKQQAAVDWERLLLCRAKELKRGGRMLMSSMYTDKDGQYNGHSGNHKGCLYSVFPMIWRQMVKEGKITQQEFVNTNMNEYFRTAEEFSAPFNDEHSLVSKAGLRLREVNCHFYENVDVGGLEGQRKNSTNSEAKRKHARNYVNMVRPWSNSTFYLGLSSNRSEEERTSLVDEVYDRYFDIVAENPEDYGIDVPVIYMDIEKEK